MKFTLNCKAGVTWTEMLALRNAPSDQKVNRAQKCSLNRVQLSGKRVSSDTIFACIFVHFWPNFTSHSLPKPFSFMLIFVMFFSLCLHSPDKQQEHKFDWYYWSPNNSSTGLLTFQNSPVVVPPHPDPALEPPLPPLNIPTT